MGSGLGVRVSAFAVLASMGCDGLSERPGADFSLRVLDEPPITVVGQIFAPVRFAVDGCGSFDLALEDGAGARRPLTFEERPDGTHVASVPVAWMRERVGCRFSSLVPSQNEEDPGTLVATCQDAGRSARAAFSINPRLGGGWTDLYGDVRAVFPGGDLAPPWWIATSAYAGEVALPGARYLGADWAPALNPAVYANPLVRPRLARSGDRVFATLGCETYPECPPVSIGPGESRPGERLADIALTDDVGAPPRGVAHVSTNVVDMAFAEDGALVVVSDTSIARSPTWFPIPVDDDDARWGETIVWRVVPAPEGSQGVVEDAATVIARLPRETVVSRLSRTPSGALSFATVAKPGDHVSSVSLNLHVTDGSTVTTSYTASGSGGCSVDLYCLNRLSGPGKFVNPGIYLSPDGSSMVVTSADQDVPDWELLYWINTDPADRVWQPFGHRGYPRRSPEPRQQLYYEFDNGGAAWLPGAVALWTGGDIMFPDDPRAGPSRVQVFEATPPRVLRYEYEVEALPGATRTPHLVGAIAVGDHLVLTTTTGLRILDASGRLVGGTDPFACGATTTAAAEQVGPTTVAVGVGDTVVTFEVAEGP